MSGELLFNVDKIVALEFQLSRVSKFKFYPKEENRRKTILGVELWKLPDLPDRWSEYSDPNWNYTLDSSMKSSNQYIVQDLPKMVFYAPWVRINFSYRHYIFERFNSDEEVKAFVEKVKAKSNVRFEIINKR